MDKKELKETANLIKKTFSIDEDIHLNGNVDDSYRFLRDRLAEYLAYLIDKEQDRLMAILYRIDIREEQFAKTLKQNSVADIPYELSDLILKRQREKIFWRQKFAREAENGE